jgi:RHS repeat-associated protein
VISWSYDAAGNLLSDGTTTRSYDALNRLVAQDSTSYTYNGDGVLVSDGTTTYAQDLAAPLSQVLNDGTANYLYGHERLRALGGPWYVGDALGSVHQTLDDAGAVLATTSYDPWGTPQGSLSAPFGFTGELHSAGQVYLRARWYAPGQGRFVSEDPFVGWATRPYSLHPYQYAYSNPVMWTDPTGECVGWLWGDPTCQFIGRDRILRGDLEWEEARPWAGAGLDVAPVTGDIKGFLEVFTGCDLVTGEDLGAWRWAGLVPFAGPRLRVLRSLRHADEIVSGMRYTDNAARAITGARRSPLTELTPTQIEQIRQEFREIGGDPDILRFNEGAQTGYVDGIGIIRVRGDVLPLEGVNHPRSRMSTKAVLAHELAHARYDGTPLLPGAWNDEFRASYMAAKDTPGLSPQDRFDLITDAVERAREAGVSISYNDFMRRMMYGNWELE